MMKPSLALTDYNPRRIAWLSLVSLVLMNTPFAQAQKTSVNHPSAVVQRNGPSPTPPMGWNSWDSYGTTVTEAQVKANADAMARDLKSHGWQYIVVDIQWYEPNAQGHDYAPGAKLAMDEYGRLLPAVNRFPSSADGTGFKHLADYVHSKGLKFGIHIMRGIPRQAVEQN